jgi:hypothetical protein
MCSRIIIKAGSEFWVAQTRPNIGCLPTIKYLKKIKVQFLNFFNAKSRIYCVFRMNYIKIK